MKNRKKALARKALVTTKAHERYLEWKGNEERSGVADIACKGSDALFAIDKTPAALSETLALRARKVDRVRGRLLRCDSILSRHSLVLPVPWQRKTTKGKNGAALLSQSKRRKVKGVANSTPENAVKFSQNLLLGKSMPDLSTATHFSASSLSRKRGKSSLVGSAERKDPWEEEEGGNCAAREIRPCGSLVPAVEVDAPGCSFHPPKEQHQEALAVAVSNELLSRAEEGMWEEEGRAILREAERDRGGAEEEKEREEEELARLLLASQKSGEEVESEDERGIAGGDGSEVGPETNVSSHCRKTRAERNREKRRRETEEKERERRKEEEKREEIESLPSLELLLSEEEGARELRRERRKRSLEDRKREMPERLGKHKFDPEPLSVLLTEEVSGSLRKLKPCLTLLRDRFKSLQKRGVIEPTIKVKRSRLPRRRRFRVVDQGSQGEREREMHAERESEKREREKAKRRKQTGGGQEETGGKGGFLSLGVQSGE